MEQPDIEIKMRVSREFLDQLQGWNGPLYVRLLPEVDGYRDFEFIRSPFTPLIDPTLAVKDPLGVTPEHRERGKVQAEIDSVRAITREFLKKIREGLELLDSLPDGTVIREPLTGVDIPIERYR